ncbi:hypothetical protein [Tropicimonas aquimaris]|uniref:Uncharacterized protein n=1 Tax=Tropicimonas aquimaris TaxID=914152 RepID=A0ABW3IQU0_9RHOB
MKLLKPALFSAALAMPSLVYAMSEASDACIDALRATGTPDAQGGEVLSSSYSEAGTLVMLRDLGGSEYKCIVWSDGRVGELTLVNAMDDGKGAMAGNKAPVHGSSTKTHRVQFARGTSGATYDGTLTPGSTVRYVLGAANGQFLDVNIRHHNGRMSYQIWNPDGTSLLDMIPAKTPYRGQLWQSGDHVVELINRGKQTESFTVEFHVK